MAPISQQPSPFHFSQIFLKLEEESERRAMEAEEAALSPNIPDLVITAQRAAQRRQRNRGSISVSRFGHVGHDHPSHARAVRLIALAQIEEGTQQQTSLIPSQMPPPPAFVHGMTTFYGLQSHVRLSLARLL
jgi:hypothetical protein